jgi:hypothetical protein
MSAPPPLAAVPPSQARPPLVSVPQPAPSPDLPSVPKQRNGPPSLLEEPLPEASADDFSFTGSVMSDLAFPEPFIPEPYEDTAFGINGYPADGPTDAEESDAGEGRAERAGRADHADRSERPERRRERRHERAESPEPRQRPEPPEVVLPKRVPAVPDVPDEAFQTNDPLEDTGSTPVADGVERIANFLRGYQAEDTDERPDGFDLNAVLTAVRSVPEVREAQLRWNPGSSGHTLRIEFEDGADEGMVTQKVALILRDKMGLAAGPSTTWLTHESMMDRAGRTPAQRGPTASGAATRSAAAADVRADQSRVEQSRVEQSRAEQARADQSRVEPARADQVRAEPKRAEPTRAEQGRGQPVRADQRPEAAAIAAQSGRALPPPTRVDGQGVALSRVVVEHVQVTTLGVDATVEVRLAVSRGTNGTAGNGRGNGPTAAHAVGTGHGPAVDAYLLRLAAGAAADAIGQLLIEPDTGASRGRCFVEHVGVVPFAGIEVAVVVVLLVCGSFAEQLVGSALVSGDPRQAVVRATLSAVNRRLESLLA